MARNVRSYGPPFLKLILSSVGLVMPQKCWMDLDGTLKYLHILSWFYQCHHVSMYSYEAFCWFLGRLCWEFVVEICCQLECKGKIRRLNIKLPRSLIPGLIALGTLQRQPCSYWCFVSLYHLKFVSDYFFCYGQMSYVHPLLRNILSGVWKPVETCCSIVN